MKAALNGLIVCHGEKGGDDYEAVNLAMEAIFIAESGVGYDGLPPIDQPVVLFDAVKMATVMKSAVRAISAATKGLRT